MLAGLETRYQGGLLVVEQAQDERAVQRGLQRLDDRLFLDKERDLNTGIIFYTVKYHRGDQPPDLVLDWRNADDTPRSLSSGVVTEVQRMMAGGTIEEKLARAKTRQAELDEEKRRQNRANYQAVADEFNGYDSEIRSGVLPRSQGLRMSRDKQRAKGRKV